VIGKSSKPGVTDITLWAPRGFACCRGTLDAPLPFKPNRTRIDVELAWKSLSDPRNFSGPDGVLISLKTTNMRQHDAIHTC